ncbi:ABC transporter permease [Kineococcus sp. NPDC059986]|uniref:ABC transporter permease n=1 Tax=Kineococcus sp. NPDC059986 TaxID=3155538 RepID=UPI00344F516B
MNGRVVLLRCALRRDRVRAGLPVLLLGVLPAATASSYARLYPTVAERATLDATARRTPALQALYGPVGDLTTAGGFTAWRVGSFLAAAVALVAVFTAVRHTRAEEDAGRADLVAAGAVGRSAPTDAAALLAAGAAVLTGLVTALALAATGAGAAGSLLLGLVTGLVGATGAGLGLLAAQVLPTARSARAVASAVVGAAFLLRAAADTAPRGSALSGLGWLSPLAWVGRAQPFAGDHWPVLLAPLALTAGLLALTRLLRRHRDLGAGLVAPRGGRAGAPGWLRSTTALAWRLARGSVLGWCLGTGLAGAALGTLTPSVSGLLAGSAGASDVLRSAGGAQQVGAAFLGTLTAVYGLVAAAAGVQAAVHAREEEAGGHLDLLLATGGRRLPWFLGHLSVGLLASALTLLCGVAATRATAGAAAPAWGPSLTAAATQLPAVWFLTAVGFALAGALPRWAALAWAVLAATTLAWFAGPLLGLGSWVGDLSPTTHLPAAPGAPVAVTATVVLGAAAVALLVAGAVAVTRRDLRGR